MRITKDLPGGAESTAFPAPICTKHTKDVRHYVVIYRISPKSVNKSGKYLWTRLTPLIEFSVPIFTLTLYCPQELGRNVGPKLNFIKIGQEIWKVLVLKFIYIRY